MLTNPRGIDKTQNGIARVDRRASVDVVLRTEANVRAVREMTESTDLPASRELRVTIPAGDLKVIRLTVAD
jgi:hypothetical protein